MLIRAAVSARVWVAGTIFLSIEGFVLTTMSDVCMSHRQNIIYDHLGVYKNNVNGDDTPGVDDFRGRLRDSANMDFRLDINAVSCSGGFDFLADVIALISRYLYWSVRSKRAHTRTDKAEILNGHQCCSQASRRHLCRRLHLEVREVVRHPGRQIGDVGYGGCAGR